MLHWRPGRQRLLCPWPIKCVSNHLIFTVCLCVSHLFFFCDAPFLCLFHPTLFLFPFSIYRSFLTLDIQCRRVMVSTFKYPPTFDHVWCAFKLVPTLQDLTLSLTRISPLSLPVLLRDKTSFAQPAYLLCAPLKQLVYWLLRQKCHTWSLKPLITPQSAITQAAAYKELVSERVGLPSLLLSWLSVWG